VVPLRLGHFASGFAFIDATASHPAIVTIGMLRSCFGFRVAAETILACLGY